MTLGSVNCKRSECQSHEEQKEILTLEATTKAFFHSQLANVAFAHSLNSGVGVHESKVVRSVGGSLCWAVFEAASPSLSGAERNFWVKSAEKFRTHGNQTG